MGSVTRKPRRSRIRRREDIQARMLASVEELLGAGENLTRLSVERLTAAAGVPRSTFYVYFADKGELLISWLGQITHELEDAAAAWWRLDGSSERPDLRAALAAIVHAYQPHGVLMGAVYDAASYDDELRAEIDTITARNSGGLRRHIVAGQRGGWVDTDLPARETAGWLMCMAARGQHKLVADADPDDTEVYIDALTDIVWNSLYAPTRG